MCWQRTKEHRHIYTDHEQFWFEDETNQLNGPYKTFDEALQQFKLYCDIYL